MVNRKSNLKRQQLDDALRVYPTAKSVTPPRSGWIRSIREALGMTQSQLGAKLGISRQSVQDFEKAEVERRITLDSLDRLARAMGCRLVYALTPETGSLDDLRTRRAEAIADAMLKPTTHSMKLEDQGVSKRTRQRQRKELIDTLLTGSARNLWR
jgi:predicted DNA-binding mobile mystery protein A